MTHHRRQAKAMSDEEIRAATIGALQPYATRVIIVDYDPSWPERYEEEAARIRAAVGARALEIHHIGSTAVPGLPAKPVIDILLVVSDSAAEETYVPAMEAAGYSLRIREPDFHEHRVFRGPADDVNVHVFSSGSPEIERHLVFRDWLRANEADRRLYANVKRELAAREWRYVQHYADAKTEVVEAILRRATR
jgi:GrpB-like predicted nucleotidyltransferase (UPF0157 family)